MHAFLDLAGFRWLQRAGCPVFRSLRRLGTRASCRDSDPWWLRRREFCALLDEGGGESGEGSGGLKRGTGRAVGLLVFWSTLKQSPSTLKALASATAARETGPALCSRIGSGAATLTDSAAEARPREA